MLDSAIAFTEATRTLVADMKARGYRHDDPNPIASPGTRPIQDVWRASSAVAHFMLQQAFEAYLKLILALQGERAPNIYPLAKLHDRLSRESKLKFDRLCRHTVKAAQTNRLIAIAFVHSHTRPTSPPDANADTVGNWFTIMDEQMRLHLRRYEAEDIKQGRWTIYFVEYEPLFEMLAGIRDHATTLFKRSVRNGPSRRNASS